MEVTQEFIETLYEKHARAKEELERCEVMIKRLEGEFYLKEAFEAYEKSKTNRA